MKYEDLDAQLTGRNRNRRKPANNTYAIRHEDNSISIRLHATNILTFRPGGRVFVTSGGWKTVTTKARLNEYLPYGYYIAQNRGVWYWGQHLGNGKHETHGQFTDGDVIQDGVLKLKTTPTKEDEEKKLRKQIDKYAKLCAESVPLPHPSNGDCWHCLMKTEDGKTLGDVSDPKDHLISHLEENYIVPSLVYNALKEKGYTDFVVGGAFKNESNFNPVFSKDAVKRSVKRYMARRLGLVS